MILPTLMLERLLFLDWEGKAGYRGVISLRDARLKLPRTWFSSTPSESIRLIQDEKRFHLSAWDRVLKFAAMKGL
jgi:hypothetical protein